MEIREYAPADEEQVVALWTSVFGCSSMPLGPRSPSYAEARNDPRRVLAHKTAWDARVLIAADGARVLGTLMVGYDGHRGWFYRLAVLESARRGGIGRALVSEGERRLRALGCQKLNLQVHTHNDAAARFWSALGYRREPRVDFGKDLSGETPAKDAADAPR
jgi:ribosomal protein S18 acetylase RimI-like enzyme